MSQMQFVTFDQPGPPLARFYVAACRKPVVNPGEVLIKVAGSKKLTTLIYCSAKASPAPEAPTLS